jgi:Ca2+-binding RTX toxin-like protein
MSTHKITADQTGVFNVDEADSTWIFTPESSLFAPDTNESGVFVDAAFTHTKLIVNTFAFGDAFGIDVRSDKSSITVGQNGSIGGVDVAANHVRFQNDGDVYGAHAADFETSGFFARGNSVHVNNNGNIYGDVFVEGDDASVINSKGGVITALETAVVLNDNTADETARLVNNGMIKASIFSIIARDGQETIVNHGTIDGSVSLAGGDDTFDNRGGTVINGFRNGDRTTVDGGRGNDTYFVDDSHTPISELAVGDLDSVFSSATFTLGQNIERLALTGKGNINGTGNGIANAIRGNSANNTIKALAGSDQLGGGGGHDVLVGGGGRDTFFFALGDGHDTVADFTHRHDFISLQGIPDAQSSFADFEKHHLTVSGHDLIVHYGDDSWTLHHVAKGSLDPTNILF